MNTIKTFLLIAFMAVATRCEHWGDMFISNLSDGKVKYSHPRCIEVNTIFETKKGLVDFLRVQDHRSLPLHRAYKIEPIEYDLEVETGERQRQETIIETVETKREIKFK